MSRIRLILLPLSAAFPASFLTLDAQGTVLTRGVVTLGGPQPEPMRTVAIVPGADVLVRWLDLPAASPAQAAAVAIHLLRDDLAAAADRLTVALGPATGPRGRRLAALVGRSLLEAWSDYLASLGIRPDVMIPDSLVLPEPTGDDDLTAATFGADLAMRGHEMALSIQPDLADAVAAGRRVRRVEGAEDIERLLVIAALHPPVNLLAGTARRADASEKRGWRRAAALAAAVVLSPLLVTFASAGHDEWSARAADQRAERAARAAFPDIGPGVNAASEATRRLATTPPPGGVTAAAAALFTAVEAVEGAELDGLATDRGMVRATVTYAAYEDLDALKQTMARLGMTLIEDSTLDDQGKVVSEVRVGGA